MPVFSEGCCGNYLAPQNPLPLAAAPERHVINVLSQNQTLASKLRQYKKVICKKKKEGEGKESLWRKDSLSVEMTYDGAFFF